MGLLGQITQVKTENRVERRIPCSAVRVGDVVLGTWYMNDDDRPEYEYFSWCYPGDSVRGWTVTSREGKNIVLTARYDKAISNHDVERDARNNDGYIVFGPEENEFGECSP